MLFVLLLLWKKNMTNGRKLVFLAAAAEDAALLVASQQQVLGWLKTVVELDVYSRSKLLPSEVERWHCGHSSQNPAAKVNHGWISQSATVRTAAHSVSSQIQSQLLYSHKHISVNKCTSAVVSVFQNISSTTIHFNLRCNIQICEDWV